MSKQKPPGKPPPGRGSPSAHGDRPVQFNVTVSQSITGFLSRAQIDELVFKTANHPSVYPAVTIEYHLVINGKRIAVLVGVNRKNRRAVLGLPHEIEPPTNPQET